MSYIYANGNEYTDKYFENLGVYELEDINDEYVYVKCHDSKVIALEIEVFSKVFTKGDINMSVDNKKELRNEEIKKACDELAELLIKKNNDYGDSFAQQYSKYGLVSALIRMDDKMRRLENLSKVGNAEVNESIADTLLDLSGYSLLAYVEAMKKDN